MKILIKLIIGCAAIFTTLAYAGQTQPAEVDVNLTDRTALGDMHTARFDSDDDVFIGCGIRAFDDGAGGATGFGFCQAEDSEGNRAFCNTSNKELLSVMKATSDFAYVTFSWNEDDVCTRIGFSTQSFYIPKKLK